MHLRKAIIKKSLKEKLKAFTVILLLAFYTIGNTQVQVIHQLFHPHHITVTHSVQKEKDPCHRAVYHASTDEGCKHKSHFTVIEKCDLCHLFFHNDQVASSRTSSEFIQFFSTFTESLISFRLTGITVQLPLRAPPFS